MEAINRYLEILVDQFEYDVSTMSQPWMYYLIIPAAAYLVFFLIKWWILTTPVWIPLWFVFRHTTKIEWSKK